MVQSAQVLPAPAAGQGGRWPALWRRLFASPFSLVASVLLLWMLVMAVPVFFEWAILQANFTATSAQECRQSGSGACWAFIVEKHRLILFGTYPYDEQWRPLLAVVLLVALILCSVCRYFWNWRLAALWTVGLALSAWLMWGGFGLSHVENSRWGGLPLTLMLATFGIAFAFPLGVLLALGRRSRMPVIKALSVVYIELIRGVPMISILFMSSVMLPLFLPEGVTIDKLLRAGIAIVLFAAAYIAETVRGGLQAIPRGQYEGAESMGLSYWQGMRLVILPQALKTVIPPLVNVFIALFKDTSLVVIIGIFDLTLAAKAALSDAAWRGVGVEAYLFLSVIYFVCCYAMSRYSRSLEAKGKIHE